MAITSYFEVVDGIRLPVRLGGHPALDFCNTLAGWGCDATVDYLQSYDALAVWAGFTSLLEPPQVALLRGRSARQARKAGAILDRARLLRADLYDLLHDPQAKPTAVEEECRAAAASFRLRRVAGAFAWTPDSRLAFDAPVLVAARAASELLTSPSLPFVRTCQGTGCGWVFLDRSGRRRWCTMAVCGNREKARRFSERHTSRSR